MPSRVKCPSCGGSAVAVGDEYRCEECGHEFDPRPAGPARREGVRGDERVPARALPRLRGEDEPEPQGQDSNVVLWVLIGVLGVLLVGAVGVGAVFFLFAAAPLAPDVEPVATMVAVEAPAPIDVPAPPPVKINPADLYGDQGGEPVAPADAGLPSTVMRARRDDTFLKLSNPREGQASGPGPKRNALLIDYEVVRRGKFDGGNLVIHTEDGSRTKVALNLIAGRDHGTIELVGVTRFGNLTLPKNATFPKNAEMYVTRGDEHYRPPSNFMVSNAVVMGEMKVTTRPRDWTAEEIALYSKPPPNYTTPNVPPTIGEDVPSLPAGGLKLRHVEPDGRLLGLDYHLGEWDKEKCVGGLVPIFRIDQPALEAVAGGGPSGLRRGRRRGPQRQAGLRHPPAVPPRQAGRHSGRGRRLRRRVDRHPAGR
jgi:rubredoxin